MQAQPDQPTAGRSRAVQLDSFGGPEVLIVREVPVPQDGVGEIRVRVPGIGQTSLGYLSSLPVGELKIDKSFVTDMLDDPAHAAIVRSVIELGHNLGLRVVAEGVEHPEVLDELGHIGCYLAQGFHIARPMSIERLATWLDPAGRLSTLPG